MLRVRSSVRSRMPHVHARICIGSILWNGLIGKDNAEILFSPPSPLRGVRAVSRPILPIGLCGGSIDPDFHSAGSFRCNQILDWGSRRLSSQFVRAIWRFVAAFVVILLVMVLVTYACNYYTGYFDRMLKGTDHNRRRMP